MSDRKLTPAEQYYKDVNPIGRPLTNEERAKYAALKNLDPHQSTPQETLDAVNEALKFLQKPAP